MKKLSHILNWDNYYIDGYGIFLFIIGFFHPWVFILSIIYFITVRKKLKLFFVLLFCSLIFLTYFIHHQKSIPNVIQGEVRVVEKSKNLYADTLTVQYKHMKFNMQSQIDQYELGDIIYVQAEVKSYRLVTIPFGFNQKNYYMSQGTYGYLDIKEVSYQTSSFSIFKYREELLDRVSTYKSSAYLKSLIFGEKDFSSEQSTLFKDLGIMYLLTISGMHVYILFITIDKVFFYLDIGDKTRHIIKILIYLILLYLNLFSIGVLRLFIMFLLQLINQKYRLMFSKLDLTTFTFLIMLVTNIYLVFSLGFLITYLILNFLYLMEFRYRAYDGYLRKLMITSIIFLVVLPFNLVISPIMILILPVIITIITGPLFLGSIVSFIIPEFDHVMAIMVSYFESFMMIINHKNFSIHLPALSITQIFLYFIMVILIFRSTRITEFLSRILLLALFFVGMISYTQTIEKVTFLDVGQGDSTIIQSGGCVIVVDSFTNAENYLKNQGIYKIDYLILTHSDLDHTKEAISIIESMHVKKVVLSLYDTSYEAYKGEKIYVKSGDELKCRSLTINILGPIRNYQVSNNNSIVLQVKIDNLTYLLTGDIELDAENDLIELYGYHLKSDVLKVPHHGSSTSSSDKFIYYVNPEISIISLGYGNKFGFPDSKVIERLLRHQSIIYRTDIHGSIIYTPSKKKEKWTLVLPF